MSISIKMQMAQKQICLIDLTDGGRCGKESLFCFFCCDGCRTDGKIGCYKKIVYDGWQIKKDYPWK